MRERVLASDAPGRARRSVCRRAALLSRSARRVARADVGRRSPDLPRRAADEAGPDEHGRVDREPCAVSGSRRSSSTSSRCRRRSSCAAGRPRRCCARRSTDVVPRRDPHAPQDGLPRAGRAAGCAGPSGPWSRSSCSGRARWRAGCSTPRRSSTSPTSTAPASRNHGDRLWLLVNLEIWHRVFVDGEDTAHGPGRGMKPQRILWVKVGGLWPLNTGGRLRSFHILSELSRHHRVTLLTTHGPDDDPDGLAAALPQLRARRVVPASLSAKQGSARFAAAVMRSWLSDQPVDLWKCRCRPSGTKSRALIAEGRSTSASRTFWPPCPTCRRARERARRALRAQRRAHDLAASHRGRIPAWRRLPLEIEWRKMRRFESRACTAPT